MVNTVQEPTLGSASNLCLSCHDGTVAVGNNIVSGQVSTTGQMNAKDQFLPNTPNLLASHPQNLSPIKDTPDLYVGVVSKGQTNDPTGSVKLINGDVECTSCHNPHVQAKDPVAQYFLAKNSVQGALCLSCHDPTRAVQGQTNPLTGWSTSIHATSGATVQNLPYATLSQNACLSCHQDHNAPGTDWVLRGVGDQDCLNCHAPMSPNIAATNGRVANNGAPALAGQTKIMASLNVGEEYAKIGHPISLTASPVQLRGANRNQSAMAAATPNATSSCIDCHNPHSVQSGTTNAVLAPAPAIRPALAGAAGVSEKDGVTMVRPAQYEYQVCLRCHGPQAKMTAESYKYGYGPARLGSVAQPLNLLPQFGTGSVSSHPVFHPRSSPLPQPSLLQNMWSLNGVTPGKPMGAQIFCTDCHNSDDNRELGGTGPVGPHGSKWSHILERRYEFSQAPAPGQPITNLNPNPDLSVIGPYALCGKCHNLSNIMQNASFAKHAEHIRAGFSCSACHTAHGVGITSANTTGQRLISFDTKVVAPNGGSPIAYNQGPGTCTLTCHNAAHNPNGSVTLAGAASALKK
jgi:predicted CXXCH cytochrome family protein